MARTTLKEVKKLTLEDMIDKYGELSAAINNMEKEKKFLKGQIDMGVVLLEGEEVAVVEAGEFQAEKYFAKKTTVSPERVKEFDEDTFWRLVKIGVTDAEAVLPADVFHDCVSVELSNIPSLRIVKKKAE